MRKCTQTLSVLFPAHFLLSRSSCWATGMSLGGPGPGQFVEQRPCPDHNGPSLPRHLGATLFPLHPLRMSSPEVPRALSKRDLDGVHPEARETCPSLSASWGEPRSVWPLGALSQLNSNREDGDCCPQGYQELLPKECFSKRFFKGKLCKKSF